MSSVLKKLARAFLLVPALAVTLGVLSPVAVSAAECPTDIKVSGGIQEGVNCAKPTKARDNLFGKDGIFVTVTNILLFIIGAIAVVMLIIGGIRYVVSNGDQNAVTSAKNTILYAVIGIVVAFLAFAAVQFVVNQLDRPTNAAHGVTRQV